MKIKINSVLLICIILYGLFLLTGCSTEAPTADNDQKETVKIGGNFELTGDVAEFGNKGEKGAKLAIKEINAAGGVLGRQIEYIGQDNRSLENESAAVTAKLVSQDRVTGIIGPMTIRNTLAAIPIVSEKNIPLITPTGTAGEITIGDSGVNKWIFRACFIDFFQGEVAAHFAYDSLKLKTAAMILNQSEYSKGLAESFKKTFEDAGGLVVASEEYIAGQDKDFRDILASIKDKNPDLIYVPGYYGEAGLIIRQARNENIAVPIIGGDGWGIGLIAEIAGKEALNNTYYTDHVALDDPALANFVAAYRKAYNQDPDSFAVLGYDAARLLIAGIEKAQSTNTEKVRHALETMTGFVGVSGQINIDPTSHNPKKSVAVIKFVDGRKVFAYRVDPKQGVLSD